MKKIISTIIFSVIFIAQVSYAQAAIGSLEIISKNSVGTLGNDESYTGSISGDGSSISFVSVATNLVAGDTNAAVDIFVYDVSTGDLERVSLSSLGAESNGDSGTPVITSDGRYVAFVSSATNLVAGDTNGAGDIFLYDRDNDTIELVSVAADDGLANDESFFPSISSDGRYVAFVSSATNLVAGDINGVDDIFVRDMTLGTTERVSVNSDEEELNNSSYTAMISKNGSYVVFESDATDAVAGDTNSAKDIFLRDLTLGTTEIISVDSNEVISNSDSFVSSLFSPKNVVTDDGRYVLFESSGTNLVSGDTNGSYDIFLRDRTLGTTRRVSISEAGVEADADSFQGSIDSGGRFISFMSESDLLVPGDTTSGKYDIFVYDMDLETLSRVSVAVDGTESDGYSEAIGIFSDGSRYIAYYSDATNLVAGDTNGVADIFFAEITDEDGISSSIEDAAPNNGDVNENNYDDAIEQNITSFVNSVSGNYTTVQTTGNCVSNSEVTSAAESSLATQDSGYDYPLGIISFEVNCKEAGETATVSVYCFCEVTPVDGTLARKYNESTGEYTTIDSAVIEEVTIDGERALRMTYDVVDGGALDEDGLENGTIIDPVGFARVTAPSSSGGSSSSSSGSRPSKSIVALNTLPTPPITTNDDTACTTHTFTTSMKKGSKQGEVNKLQELLNKEGMNAGTVDGLFGPMTHNAVKMFQTKHILDSDGIVGPMTRSVLNTICS